MNQHKNGNYGKFAAMIVTSMVAMYLLMYLNSNSNGGKDSRIVKVETAGEIAYASRVQTDKTGNSMV